MTKILFFSAPWCTACTALKGNLKDEDLVNVEFIDVDNEPEMTIDYNIRSIPTLIKVDESGEEVGRKIGSMSRAHFADWARV